MELKDYDSWKTTDHADRELGHKFHQPVRFRCEDCAWTGTGYQANADHFRTGHRTRMVIEQAKA